MTLHDTVALSPGDARASDEPGAVSRRILVLHLLVGVATGAVLWLVHRALTTGQWPGTSGAVSYAIGQGAVAAALGWVLLHGVFRSERRRLASAVLFGGVHALLGAHAGANAHLLGHPLLGGTVPAAAVSGFVTLALVAGFDAPRRRFDYPRLFALATRNALLLPTAAALTGLLWMVLVAAAFLMDSIGLPAMRRLLEAEAFGFITTGGAFGLATGVVLARAHMLPTLRRFLLSLVTWFLPLALAFAVAWVAALAFTGVQPLFATRSGAFYTFWFATLCIVFANAAFQDGREPPPYAPALARALAWAWLAVPPLALLGCWALGLRVAQHGWTPERLWAAVVGLLVALHAAGYAASVLLRRRGWLATMPATNVAAAGVLVAVVTLLLTPLADVNRLAVQSQVARLHAGAVDVEHFDWRFLGENRRYGRPALEALARQPGADATTRAIAQRAGRELAQPTRASAMVPQDSTRALAALQREVAVMPAGQRPDPALLEWLARPNADWDERSCVSQPPQCALWLVDVDGDGQSEAVLLWEREQGVQALLYAREAAGWRKQSALRGGPQRLQAWREAVQAGDLQRKAPRWPDLQLGEQRLQVTR